MADEHISPHDEDTLPDQPELTPVSPLAETVADQSEPIPPAPIPSWPPAQRSFREPERFPRGGIILLAIIALILIGSSFGFILYATTVQYRTSLHQQATFVPQSTGQAQKTALARNQATANAMATANSNIYATATAQTGATATL